MATPSVWLQCPFGWLHSRAGALVAVLALRPAGPGTLGGPVPPVRAVRSRQGTGGVQEGTLGFVDAHEGEEQLSGTGEGSLSWGCCPALAQFPGKEGDTGQVSGTLKFQGIKFPLILLHAGFVLGLLLQ